MDRRRVDNYKFTAIIKYINTASELLAKLHYRYELKDFIIFYIKLRRILCITDCLWLLFSMNSVLQAQCVSVTRAITIIMMVTWPLMSPAPEVLAVTSALAALGEVEVAGFQVNLG